MTPAEQKRVRYLRKAIRESIAGVREQLESAEEDSAHGAAVYLRGMLDGLHVAEHHIGRVLMWVRDAA